MLLVPNGSPYELDKDDKRVSAGSQRGRSRPGLPLAYLNRVGGQDELVFDGSSFVVHPDGERVVQLPDWDEASADHRLGAQRPTAGAAMTREAACARCVPGGRLPGDDGRACAIMCSATAFPGVILGLSGGIDSALVGGGRGRRARRRTRSWGVMLPSKYTSEESLEDARECARLLGCRHDVISIAPGGRGARRDACRDLSGLGGGECPGAASHGGADGPVQRGRADAADDRQQERDERRLCDALRRHGRRLFGAEGRLQDDGVRAVALAQRQQAGRRAGSGRTGDAGAGDHQAADRRAPPRARRTRTACRLIRCSTASSKAWSTRRCR